MSSPHVLSGDPDSRFDVFNRPRSVAERVAGMTAFKIIKNFIRKGARFRMPNMRSAAKRMKSDARKGERNQTVLSELHNRFKKLVPLVGENKELAKKQALVL